MKGKWISILIVIILLIAVGVFVLKLSKKTTTQNTQATETPTTAQQATTQPSKMVQENLVTLTQNGFTPATLTIKAGTTVTWTNKSGQDATVNSNPHPTHTNYPPLNLGHFSDGQSLTLPFDKPGTYGYHNHLDPSQQGTIVVQ